MLAEEIVTTGAIAGLNDGVSYTKKKFANATIFDVDFNMVFRPNTMKHPRKRYKQYFLDEDFSNTIRDYSKENPKEPIILRCNKTGKMVYFKKPVGG